MYNQVRPVTSITAFSTSLVAPLVRGLWPHLRLVFWDPAVAAVVAAEAVAPVAAVAQPMAVLSPDIAGEFVECLL